MIQHVTQHFRHTIHIYVIIFFFETMKQCTKRTIRQTIVLLKQRLTSLQYGIVKGKRNALEWVWGPTLQASIYEEMQVTSRDCTRIFGKLQYPCEKLKESKEHDNLLLFLTKISGRVLLSSPLAPTVQLYQQRREIPRQAIYSRPQRATTLFVIIMSIHFILCVQLQVRNPYNALHPPQRLSLDTLLNKLTSILAGNTTRQINYNYYISIVQYETFFIYISKPYTTCFVVYKFTLFQVAKTTF